MHGDQTKHIATTHGLERLTLYNTMFITQTTAKLQCCSRSAPHAADHVSRGSVEGRGYLLENRLGASYAFPPGLCRKLISCSGPVVMSRIWTLDRPDTLRYATYVISLHGSDG